MPSLNVEKTLSDTKKVLGIVAVVCSSLIVAIDLIQKEVNTNNKTEETMED